MPYKTAIGKFMLLSGVAGARAAARCGWRGRGSRLICLGITGGGLFLMIGRVEAGALKDHPASAADQAHQLLLAAFGAFLELGFGHALQGFKPMLTCFTFIFVCRHII